MSSYTEVVILFMLWPPEGFYGFLVRIPVHGTIDSTTLNVTGHEFLFRFFYPDQSFSPSDQSGIDCAMYWNRLYTKVYQYCMPTVEVSVKTLV